MKIEDASDRPVITEKMLKAGLEALAGYDPNWDRSADLVKSILECALVAQREQNA